MSSRASGTSLLAFLVRQNLVIAWLFGAAQESHRVKGRPERASLTVRRPFGRALCRAAASGADQTFLQGPRASTDRVVAAMDRFLGEFRRPSSPALKRALRSEERRVGRE